MTDSRDNVPWLNEDERTAWIALGALMTRLPSILDAQLEEVEGLSYFDYMILAMLSEDEARQMQMSDLAGILSASLSRLSHAVTRLEKKGFLERERMPGQGRKTLAILTDKGYDKVVAAAPGHVRHVRTKVLDVVTPEQLQSFEEMSKSILKNLETETSVSPVTSFIWKTEIQE